MNTLFLGTPEDVAAFALAGIEGVVCGTRAEAERLIQGAAEDVLIIVSAELYDEEVPRGRYVVALPTRE